MNTRSRRQFLSGALSAGAALTALRSGMGGSAHAVEAFSRAGKPRLLLSLAAYSFRQFFEDGNRDAPSVEVSRRLDMFRFIDFCADHGCAGAELTSYYFPKSLDRDYLLRVKRHAFLRGIAVSGTAVGNTFTHPAGEKREEQIAHVKQWIEHAAVLGAPHIRVFAGGAPQGMDKAEAKRLCIAALEECGEAAGRHGIFLGLENHGGIVAEADDLLEIVCAVRSPWIGINLDSGNFRSDDPYADLARCAPYTVNAQIKVEVQPRGKPKEATDLERVIRILRDANYQGYVALEYESAEDPWVAVPRYLRQMKPLLAG